MNSIPWSFINNPLKVKFNNSNFLKNNGINDALFFVTTNSEVTIDNCDFQENYSKGKGSILYGETYNSQVFVTNSNFTSNYAE